MEEIGGTLFKPVLWLIRTLGDVVLNVMQKFMIEGAGNAVTHGAGGGELSREMWKSVMNRYAESSSKVDNLKQGQLPLEMYVAYLAYSDYEYGKIDEDGNYVEDHNSGEEIYGAGNQSSKSAWMSQDKIIDNFLPNYKGKLDDIMDKTEYQKEQEKYADNPNYYDPNKEQQNYFQDQYNQPSDEETIEANQIYEQMIYNIDDYEFVYDGKAYTPGTDEFNKALTELINDKEGIDSYNERMEIKKNERLENENTVILNIKYSPIKIFTGGVKMLDVNFINPQEGSVASDLQSTISSWYLAFRNLAALMLLSVLVYVGIRILLSTAAGETAKYKSMLKDWLVGLCLLFFLHYMMAFFFGMTNIIINGIGNDNNQIIDENGCDVLFSKIRAEAEDTDENIEYMPSNYGITPNYDITEAFGYTILFWVMIFYTIMFTWKYLKRVTYLAFLTIIAPLVAMTYPIDKLRDGSAQAYNMWFKEYLFNILIQPVHLMLFIVLISSAIDLAQKNIIYSLVALGFVLEAENIIKNFFGFTKASGGSLSPGALLTGGAIFNATMGRWAGRNKKLGSGESGNAANASLGEASGGIKDRGLNAFKNMIPGANNTQGASGAAGAAGLAALSSGANSGTSAGTGSGNTPQSAGLSGNSSANAGGGQRRNALTGNANRTGAQRGNVSNRSHINGIKKIAGRYVNKRNAGKIGKLAMRAAGAAVVAPIGLAAGLASDKPQDVFKYAGIGAAAGGYLGGKSFDVIKNGVEDYQKGYYGSDYDRVKGNNNWAKSKETEDYYKKLYPDDYKNRIERAKTFRENGITSQRDLDRAERLYSDNKGNGLTEEQAASTVAFADEISGIDISKEENIANVKEMMKNRGIQDENQQNYIMSLLQQDKRLRVGGDVNYRSPQQQQPQPQPQQHQPQPQPQPQIQSTANATSHQNSTIARTRRPRRGTNNIRP